jgi:hypothetical protein
VLSLLLVLAVLLAVSVPAVLRFLYWFLEHAYCFDVCPDG